MCNQDHLNVFFVDVAVGDLRLLQTFVGVLQKKKKSCMCCFQGSPHKLHINKGYNLNKLYSDCFANCFPLAEKAVNNKLTA